jgi:hypothetical protein
MGFNRQKQAQLAGKEDEGLAFPVRNADNSVAYKQDGVTPCTITVAGTHSRRYRDKQKEMDRAKIRGAQTMTDAKSRGRELLVHCTLSWDIEDDEAGPVPFNRQNVMELYRDCPWIAEAAEEAMTDHAGFFETPSPEPSPT